MFYLVSHLADLFLKRKDELSALASIVIVCIQGLSAGICDIVIRWSGLLIVCSVVWSNNIKAIIKPDI